MEKIPVASFLDKLLGSNRVSEWTIEMWSYKEIESINMD